MEPTMEPQKNKVPKRVIHCSDGTVEEFSSEDETDAPKSQAELPVVNPKTLNWFPWMWYQTTWVGSKTLSACDYVGESLASFFGITDSKYQFEIREYDRMKAREAELQKKEDLEMGGWREENRNNLVDQNTSPEQPLLADLRQIGRNKPMFSDPEDDSGNFLHTTLAYKDQEDHEITMCDD